MKTRPYARPQRFGHELQKLLGDIILKELNTSTVGFITITYVQMTKDLKLAKIFISSINSNCDPDKIENYFNTRSKYIRGCLGKILTSKSIPDLKFYYDNTEAEAEKIDRLLTKLQKGNV